MSGGRAGAWSDDFLGVAYRYYDLRMNVVPLFAERGEAAGVWNGVVRFWADPGIRVRFVESGRDKYWFILAAESSKPGSNRWFYKMLARSDNYERFKAGHEGEAYLRLGIYSKMHFDDVKDDAVCNCGHEKDDHDDYEEEGGGRLHDCMEDGCGCGRFESFQVTLLRNKKTVTDILFLDEDSARDDAVAWNCLSANEYGRTADGA